MEDRRAVCEKIIEELDGRSLRNFLLELTKTDGKTADLLIRSFGPREKDPAEEIREKIRAVEKACDFSGQMDYAETCRYLAGLMDILRTQVTECLKEGRKEVVLAACLEIAESIGRAKMEQEGELEHLGIRLYETLQRLSGGEEDRERLQSSLEVIADREDHPLAPWFDEFLREELADRRRLEKALEELKSRIRASAGREQPWFSPYRGREDAGKKSLRYMEKLGRSPEEIGRFIDEGMQYPPLGRLKIQRLAEEGQNGKALELLEEWMEREKDPFRRRELDRMKKSLQGTHWQRTDPVVG